MPDRRELIDALAGPGPLREHLCEGCGGAPVVYDRYWVPLCRDCADDSPACCDGTGGCATEGCIFGQDGMEDGVSYA